MRVPELVVIGGRKCGTTWADQCFREHPGLFLPPSTKELFYFDRYYERGIDWYAAHFANAPETSLCVEVTPSYLSSPEATERLPATLPNAKLLVLLRNPVDRALSDFNHAQRKGDVQEGMRFRDACNHLPSLLEEGQYHVHLERWMYEVASDRLRVYLIEDVAKQPAAFFREVFGWLGVEYIKPESAERFVGGADGAPRSHALTRFAHEGSRALRARGWHAPVNAVKALGGKRLIFSKPAASGPDEALEAHDRDWLREFYEPTVESLERQLSYNVKACWGFK